jgi:rubrerythrin
MLQRLHLSPCRALFGLACRNGLTGRAKMVLFIHIFPRKETAMSINVQEAVRRSIQTEKNAMNFYQLGARQLKNPDARKTFEVLAREEREHAGQFFRIYTGTDIPSLETFLDSPFDNESSWIASITRLVDSDFTEQKALELAMEREKNLEEALLETAAKIEDPAVKAVFELNAKETHNHFLMIESEYARLMGMVHESDMDTYVRE